MIIVVGISASGWDSVSSTARDWVVHAPIVVGGARHLGLLPDVPGQTRMPLPSPLRSGLRELVAAHRRQDVVVMASGDPYVSGIATTLTDVVDPKDLLVLPAISSVALARAEMHWPAESHATVSVVGRDVDLVRRELAPGRRILVLSSDEHTPRLLTDLLQDCGYGASELVILSDLGDPARDPQDTAISRLNIVAITCPPADAVPSLGGWVAGLPDDAFENDGQLTKRDLRAAALARLAPVPGEHLWDVGAGAGSVGIEWMRAHSTCTATAIEGDPDRAARIARNASTLGVPGLTVVAGRAPEALAGLPRPDAIFIGGGATRDGVIEACLAALEPGGRLVVHGVTLETEQLLATLYQRYGGELTRIAVETAAPIGTFTGWTPARAVTQWCKRSGIEKPSPSRPS